jgi:hypothetical protein
MSFHRKPWPRLGLLLLAIIGVARSEDSERVYSLAEVTVIDQENKLWRAVDVTRTVEANVERLLAAGCPAAEVDAIKPRLATMWKVEPWLHLGWLAPGTAERIAELTPEFTVRLKEARVREMLNRLGGLRDPLTSVQVYAQWRTAIYQQLDDRELKDVVLLNSAPALALYGMLKGQPLTLEERRSLCLLQQEHLGSLQPATESRAYLPSGKVTRDRAEALLDYWQQMRDLLGDDRFAAYLQAAEARFARMAGVLQLTDGVTNAKVLDLWWVRKKDELADLRMVAGSERYQLKIKAEELATDILGPDALQVYLTDDDARWLKRNKPVPLFRKGQVAQKGSQGE